MVAAAAAFLLIISAPPSWGAQWQVYWPDPIGDTNMDQGDVSGVLLLFDDVADKFEFYVFADPADPLHGNLGVSFAFTFGNSCCWWGGFYSFDNVAPTTMILVATGDGGQLGQWNIGDPVSSQTPGIVRRVDGQDGPGADGIIRDTGTPVFITQRNSQLEHQFELERIFRAERIAPAINYLLHDQD